MKCKQGKCRSCEREAAKHGERYVNGEVKTHNSYALADHGELIFRNLQCLSDQPNTSLGSGSKKEENHKCACKHRGVKVTEVRLVRQLCETLAIAFSV